MFSEQGYLLRIYISEDDRYDDQPLYEWIVHRAREAGLAGATGLRGMEGFGARSHLHTTKILRLSVGLPVVIEIVDSREQLERFLPVVETAVASGLATLEKVAIHRYGDAGEDDDEGGAAK